MNNAYLAKLACDELQDTLYFGGFEYVREREIVNGSKVYKYKTKDFTLIIKGSIITIGKEKFKRIADAKRFIQMRYISE
jgi:hypothetical protein